MSRRTETLLAIMSSPQGQASETEVANKVRGFKGSTYGFLVSLRAYKLVERVWPKRALGAEKHLGKWVLTPRGREAIRQAASGGDCS